MANDTDHPTTSRFDSVWIDLPGCRIHARVSAWIPPARRSTIVLVHGWAVSSRYMMPVGEFLASHARVFAPDLPGHGQSDNPRRACTLPELADALAAVLDGFGLDRPVFLANSFGCQILIEFARRHPGRIDRAILVAPTVDSAARTLRQQVWRLCLDAFREPLSLTLLQIREYLSHGPIRLLGSVRQVIDDPVETKVNALKVPTLVIRGGRDPIVSQPWAEQIAHLLPAGRLAVIPTAAHAITYNAPDQLAKVVLAFLNEAPLDA